MNAYPAILVLIVTVVSTSVLAQPAAPASRSAFKCKVNGKVVYSDEPCLGAEKIDAEPSKGINTTARAAAPARREQQQPQAQPRPEPQAEAQAESPHRTADLEATGTEVKSGRARLSLALQRECHDLETGIARLEGEEKEASKSELAKVQNQLFSKRKRFVDLGC